MMGLHGGELLVITFATIIMPLLTLLFVIFIVYRFWNWLKRRDEDKRVAAQTRFPVDAAEDLNDRVLWGSSAQSASAGAGAGPDSVSADGGSPLAPESGRSGDEPSGVSSASALLTLFSRIASHGLDEALTACGLSERERMVLCGVCDGKTLAVLADELGVSRSTVGTYCTRAYEKLGVSSKDAAQAACAHLVRQALLTAAGLSEREAEVAALAAEGASTADIASSLVLSEATVSSHLQQAYVKLGVHSRTELAELLRDVA